MPPVNWDDFQKLPGAAQTNFESICRAVMRIHYGKYGAFIARAAQPGVEFHLKLHTSCLLGDAGRWFGWQCRWYELKPGASIGTARRRKIEDALRTTETVLPEMTDWVLWTRLTLTKSDQDWFYDLKSNMQLHLWTAADVEQYLGGDAAFLRDTYFGEWILTPEKLTAWHEESVAPVRYRWLPEVHQVVDAERRLREALGEADSWTSLNTLAHELLRGAKRALDDQKKADKSISESVGKAATAAQSWAAKLTETHIALRNGNLQLLQQLLGENSEIGDQLASLPRRLRALRQPAALSVTNVVSDIREARAILQEVNQVIGKGVIAIIAEAGCGKTQLSAQLTAPSSFRPAGVLLHGRNLNAGDSLNTLASRLSTASGIPVPSMDALIAAVDAAGQRASRRLPIVIDALNEADDPRNWKTLLSSLEPAVRRHPNVLIVCTVRGAFADMALPQTIERFRIEGFGEDAVEAVVRYFDYFKISFTDAELPDELLAHPLTLRLFCEVTNPKREHPVGVESAPGSLSALFDRYLEQATQRIVDLASHTRRFEKTEVARALDEIGIALWKEKTRTLDRAALRRMLGEENRQWTESIVSALEYEGIILRYPTELPGAERVGVVYDLLAGHLAATAILVRHHSDMATWAQVTATIANFTGPDVHPLDHDIFMALAGLMPRRLHKQQLWAMFEGKLRQRALRAAADLEGKYIDAETLAELTKLVNVKSPDVEEILKRLWNTRSIPGYPLNVLFLNDVLDRMSMADRDLRWTEWLRRERTYILSDLKWLEERWRANLSVSSVPDTLRAIWVKWVLTSTIRELRDRATRTLYWFGRGDSAALFNLTIDSLHINDPYVSERMLAASYGVALTLQNGKGSDAFRDDRLPRFAKRVFELMFSEGSPFSTTHALSRDYAKGIVEVALRWRPGLLTPTEKARISPPFTGGVRNWNRRPDSDQGKYKDGNDPLGLDWENYTMGGLARGRSTYDFSHPDFLRVKEEVLWRIHELGYSLARFGNVDAEISRSRNFRRNEPNRADRYGKKYSWIAFHELWGFRSDTGLLERRTWRDNERHPEEIDIDPSFPDAPQDEDLLGVDLLGETHRDPIRWVDNGPIPSVKRSLVCKYRGSSPGKWLLAYASAYDHDREIGRTGFLRVHAYLVAEGELAKLRHFLKSSKVEFGYERDTQEISGFFAGECQWQTEIPYARPETVRLPTGRRKVPNPLFQVVIIPTAGKEIRLGDIATKHASWRYETKYESIEIVPLAQRSTFGERGAIERSSGLVPSRQVAEFARMWLDLPTWNMNDPQGRRASLALDVPGGKSGSSLLIRHDIIDSYVKHTNSRLIWVVSGERQRLSDSGMNAAYKQYSQIFLMGHGSIEKLYENRDRRPR